MVFGKDEAVLTIFNLKECISMSRQKDRPLYICFIDLRKAYDSVNRELL